LFSFLQKALRARSDCISHAADGKLRRTEAMVYDSQPIIDYSRRIGERDIAGMMVVTGDERRYFPVPENRHFPSLNVGNFCQGLRFIEPLNDPDTSMVETRRRQLNVQIARFSVLRRLPRKLDMG
jgi:hypothetical protein